jgi:hypothetical protein
MKIGIKLVVIISIFNIIGISLLMGVTLSLSQREISRLVDEQAADEIRKLAESSGVQSKTISGVLKKIKGSIDKITKSTEGVLMKFEAIDDGVRKVTEQEANVRSAIEEREARAYLSR